MTHALRIAAALAALAVAGAAGAQGLEKAVEARKAQMQLYAWNLGMLGAMAKGQTDYDAAAARAAAGNLVALANLDQSTLWPAGSDSASMPGVSRAKAEIWSTFPDIVTKSDEMTKALDGFVEVAGGGLDSLRGGMRAVGAGCGGCHKAFREEKE